MSEHPNASQSGRPKALLLKGPTLAALSVGRDNNLNLLRITAALAVLVSHSWALSYPAGQTEPLASLLTFSLGRVAVMVFFVLSGFLITKSFDRRESMFGFVRARFLRLYPALLVALAACVLIVGPLNTSLPMMQYFSAPGTWSFMPRGLTLVWMHYDLPGTFMDNPTVRATNISLWTLKYEASCYLSVIVVGLITGFRRLPSALFLTGYLLAYASLRLHYGDLPSRGGYIELTPPFVIGAACYVYRDTIRPSLLLVLGSVVLCAALSRTPVYREAIVVAVASATLWFGFAGWSAGHRYNKVGDYSYGVYIFAFPIQQTLAHWLPGIGPWGMMACAMPLTIGAAAVSWHLVEHPALNSAPRSNARLRSSPQAG